MGRYRTIFMSDMHLGSTGCQAQQILTFLKYNWWQLLLLAIPGALIVFLSFRIKRSGE